MLRKILVCTIATLALAGVAGAQDMQLRLGDSLNLSQSQLEITSDSLDVDQETGVSTFGGGVVASQGGMRLTAENLRIEYSENPEDGRQRIDRLVADGGVTMVTDHEAVEARQAVYSLAEQTLEMTGDVVMVQGANVLAGERFFADLRAGTGRMSGQVRTLIDLE
ncbi:MAG: lipopolysaccharide export system chaperone component LptA [Rhodobacteraceae bacterium HLUCCA12]|nr:MAG: lipopolysaccharide export system chaperone component LptA [Rhodobacteraceae bacterium HLUCCA12]